MGSKKRTTLMSEDASRENWQPSLGKRALRALSKKAKKSGFGIKANLSPTDSVKFGASRGTKAPGARSSTAANPASGRRRGSRKRSFGVKIEHKF